MLVQSLHCNPPILTPPPIVISLINAVKRRPRHWCPPETGRKAAKLEPDPLLPGRRRWQWQPERARETGNTRSHHHKLHAILAVRRRHAPGAPRGVAAAPASCSCASRSSSMYPRRPQARPVRRRHSLWRLVNPPPPPAAASGTAGHLSCSSSTSASCSRHRPHCVRGVRPGVAFERDAAPPPQR